PDWLGPLVTRALGIPYVIAEASHATRRAQGATRLGHRAVERALATADLVLTVNPRDVTGVKARLRPGAQQRWLPPFIDVARFAAMAPQPHPEEQPAGLRLEGWATQKVLVPILRDAASPFRHLRGESGLCAAPQDEVGVPVLLSVGMMRTRDKLE